MASCAAEEYDVLLRDGGIARIRPLRSSDREALHALVARSSERSAYLRFFAGGTATAHAYMDRLTEPGYPGHALVALIGGTLAGVAEYIPDRQRPSADVGILLDDAVHGLGLGTLLLEYIAIDAAANGVQELLATVLADNRPMLRVIEDLGLPVRRRYDSGEVEIRIAPQPTAHLLKEIETREHEAERNSLAHVLNPRSVAVFGASRDPAKVGHRVLRNLVGGGFPGPVYPVNPHAVEVCGLPAYPDLAALPGRAELAVVASPAATVLDVARDCARHGVRGLVVLTAGFAETGDDGAERKEKELLRICRDAGMRLVGPNCLGVVNTGASLNASFLPSRPDRDSPGLMSRGPLGLMSPGPLGLMSQSGTLAVALLDRAAELGLGVSSFASVGNKADVSGNDLLEYWEDDPDTAVIGLYLESFGNPRRFGRIARRISARKPVIVVKSGRSPSGDRAVRSHTAAAATPDVAVDTLLRASGVIREDSVRDLLDTARLLAFQPLPRGRRVAIVGNSGGLGAITADACERRGLVVPELSPGTRRALRSRLHTAAAVRNPVDLTAEGDAARFASAIETVLADPGVDAVLVVYTPPFGSGLDATREAIGAAAAGSPTTVLACVAGHDGLIGGAVPSYAFPEQAVHALSRAAGHASWRERPVAPPEEVTGVDVRAARELVERDLAAHPEGRVLDTRTAISLLSCYGVHVAEPLSGHEPAAGVEMIVGGVAHEAFGPLMMAGLGGVVADLVADRAFRVPPISRAEAAEMLAELRSAPLLTGYRGGPRMNAGELEDQIVRVGRLMDDLPEVAELDLNPVVVTPSAAVAVDVRVRLAPASPGPSPFRRRLR
ncbi:GNAT family N-acetyltransferase [Planotetraspora sp. GP83]|uniref:bifunctional acetate--CoA ligase family protein/GNAT family N-acetyltransferase n=1 Tax=Planotetraspora sp. GP83 TaxID=3156264 RepID=UPI0035121FA5